jgi:hypothetical protein
MTEYYLLNGQDQVGPYSGDQIAEMRAKGILGGDDYLWREGMPVWVTIGAAFSPGGELEHLVTSAPRTQPSGPAARRKPPVLPDTTHALVLLQNDPLDHSFNQDPAGLGHAPATRPGGSSYPMASPSPAGIDDVIRCPYCGSSQFFGRRKVTGLGWTLYICALVNSAISVLLMFAAIGFCTIFLSPILAIIGFYGCQAHVNTCAKCKRDF